MAKGAREDSKADLLARIAELEAEAARLRMTSEAQPHTPQQRAAEAASGDIILALAELEAVYQVMPTGMAVLDGDLRYLRVNETLARMNGVPMADHIGRTVREIVPEVAASVEAIFRRVFETGEPMDALEFEAPTPGTAEPRVWLENATPLKDALGRSRWLLVTVLDITDRKRAEEALARSEARFLRMADTAPALLWVTDSDNRCTYLSITVAVVASGERVERQPDGHGARLTRRGRARV